MRLSTESKMYVHTRVFVGYGVRDASAENEGVTVATGATDPGLGACAAHRGTLLTSIVVTLIELIPIQ
jgi:hypothetical protein